VCCATGRTDVGLFDDLLFLLFGLAFFLNLVSVGHLGLLGGDAIVLGFRFIFIVGVGLLLVLALLLERGELLWREARERELLRVARNPARLLGINAGEVGHDELPELLQELPAVRVELQALVEQLDQAHQLGHDRIRGLALARLELGEQIDERGRGGGRGSRAHKVVEAGGGERLAEGEQSVGVGVDRVRVGALGEQGLHDSEAVVSRRDKDRRLSALALWRRRTTSL
jgi:hypothetical protein